MWLICNTMAYDMCVGVDSVSKKYVQCVYTNHISTKLLKPFSSMDRDNTKKTILSVRVEVHCKCQNARTRQIDGQCNMWYHEECVPVLPEVCNDKKMKCLGSALDVDRYIHRRWV